MSRHVIIVAIGPVQDFIAQARRTRDLWFGSHLLSEVSKATAAALAGTGATLVFPAPASIGELAPTDGPAGDGTSVPLNVANRVVAISGPDSDPEVVARVARDAAFARLRSVADGVRRRCGGLLANDVGPAWDEQIESLLEFVAAWAPMADDAAYAVALDNAVDALAARKVLREFAPWRTQRGSGVPKSSLDGARESVLAEPRSRDAKLSRRFRIAAGEQLDAVGLVKRAGGAPEQFVPVANVAFGPWLAEASGAAPELLESLRSACELADLGRVHRNDLEWTRLFPFDAQVVMEERWASLLDESGAGGSAVTWGRAHVEPLLRAMRSRPGGPYPDPLPYVACLMADGDRMGAALDGLQTAAEHQQFSRDLSCFAAEARRIVERDHRGLLIYAGGDDVLALLPLADAVSCADALRLQFSATLKAWEPAPTLSVGLGIGHVLENLGDLRELGRQAEAVAKSGTGLRTSSGDPDRNALGIVLDKRSGGRIFWRCPWEKSPTGRMALALHALDDVLPTKKVYEVGSGLRRFPHPRAVAADSDAGRASWAGALSADVRRTLGRIDGSTRKAPDPEQLGLRLGASADDYGSLYTAVDDWVSLMLIASVFTEALRATASRRAEAR